MEVPVYSLREAGTGTLLPGAKQFQVVAIDAKTGAEQVLTRQFDMERAEWAVERAALEVQIFFLTKKGGTLKLRLSCRAKARGSTRKGRRGETAEPEFSEW